MKQFDAAQRHALSEFANTVAAAWFTAGIISPFFTKPTSFGELFMFTMVGLLMTWTTLRWSLSMVKETKP